MVENPTAEKFPKSSRLVRKSDFAHVFAKAWRHSSPHFRIVSRPNDLQFHRLGLAVGKRCGNAVVRNKIKRRIREVFRRKQQSIALAKDERHMDIVFTPQAGVADLSFAELEKQILQLFARCAAPPKWKRARPKNKSRAGQGQGQTRGANSKETGGKR